ncbi:MAG TPA: hypothetical protein VK911_12130 [Vicinamibacterales bacterium]|nr:hypothetical protein [Vicinamibacterales bacterium]
MTKTRLILFGLLGMVVVLLIGYVWGAAGRGQAEDRQRELETRLLLTQAQRTLATARVDLFELNYGEASRRLEEARRLLDRLRATIDREGPREAAPGVVEALAATTEAQRFLAEMNQAAGSRAADALRALQRVESMLPRE